jgi:hypothetical protein
MFSAPMSQAILLAIHLLCMAVGVWLPVYCLLLDIKRNYGPESRGAQLKLVRHALGALAAGAVLGVFFGAAIWDRRMVGALSAVGSRLTFGIIEFGFTLAILAAYGGLVWRHGLSGRRGRWLRAGVLFIGLTNAWYHFPLLMGVVHRLRAEAFAGRLSSADFRQLAFSPSISLGAVHFLLTGVIAGGLAGLVLLAREQVSDRFLRGIAVGSIVAWAAQWPVGLTAFWRMPQSVQIEVLSEWDEGVALVVALIAVWLLGCAQVGLIVAPRSKFWQRVAWILLAAVTLQMCWLNRATGT